MYAHDSDIQVHEGMDSKKRTQLAFFECPIVSSSKEDTLTNRNLVTLKPSGAHMHAWVVNCVTCKTTLYSFIERGTIEAHGMEAMF